MPVVESPAWDAWPLASPTNEPTGNFVLMKIDPVASVAIFEDEETTRAAATLERHEWVLGLVTGLPPGLPDANGKESMSLRLELIGQGPPKDKPIASLPFAPSPQLYEDRPPIELHPRLPWPDLYLHSYYSSSVLISRIHHGPGSFQVALTEDEFAPINKRAFNDRVIWKELPPVTVEEEGDAIPQVEFAGSFAQTDSLHSSESSDDSSSSEESLYAQQREDMGMKLLKARIYAEISLDPATCPGPLGCPADLVAPVARIRELWTSWQDRMTTEMLAKRPLTDAWIQSVEAARRDSGSEPERERAVLQLADDVVLPGDVDDLSVADTDSRSAMHSPATPLVPANLSISDSHAVPVAFGNAYSPLEPSLHPTVPALMVAVGDVLAGEKADAKLQPGASLTAVAANVDSTSSARGVADAPGALPPKHIPIRGRISGLAARIRPLVIRAKVTVKKILSRRPQPSSG